MYDQLRSLEKMILDIKKQHQLVSAELSSLNQQPVTDQKSLPLLKPSLIAAIASVTVPKNN